MRTHSARKNPQRRTVKLFQYGQIEYRSGAGRVSGSFEMTAFPPPVGSERAIPFERVVAPHPNAPAAKTRSR